MPNHTTNILTVDGPQQQIDEMKRFVKSVDENGQEMLFSLAAVIPMPAELVGTVSGSESCKPEWQKQNSEQLIAKYGADEWYHWCIQNWETKWDAYDYKEWDGNMLRFCTAWSPPRPVIQALSKKFPELTFRLQYADEGWGYVGETTFAGGAVIGEEYLRDYKLPEFVEMYEEITGRNIAEEEE